MDILNLPEPINKIRLISATELISYNVKIPTCQRSQDEDRIKEIVQYQENYYKEHTCYNFTGPLTICSLNNEYNLIDGAHRYTSIKILLEKYPNFNFLVYITFISVKTIEELNENFITINKSLPVPEFIIENIKNDNQIDSKIIETNLKDLKKKFPSFFKNTNDPHIPNISTTRFGDQLQQKNIIILLNIKSAGHLLYIINEYNNKLKTQELNFFNKHYNGHANLVKAHDKCKESNFYIGLLPNFLWIDFIIKDYNPENDKYIEPVQEIKENKERQKISKTLRTQVWNKYYTLDVGSVKCSICSVHTISQLDFECGHIISHANGGPTNLDNLRPICNQCNKSMSSVNMNEFERRLRPSISDDIMLFPRFNNFKDVINHTNDAINHAINHTNDVKN